MEITTKIRGGGVNSPSLTEEQVQQLIDDAISKIDIPVADTVPSGVICAWSGSTTNVPTGWALCDGTNGTPNLKNRFIFGAGTYAVGTSGGAETVSLTSANIPAHNHPIYYNYYSYIAGSSGTIWYLSSFASTLNASVPSGTKRASSNTGDSTGTGTAHNNMPPYYVLAYIMKL